jgi:hypothetical protein
MDIKEIKLGDTIRLTTGKKVVVFAVYDHNNYYEICCCEVYSGFLFDDLAANNWVHDYPIIKMIPNWKEFIGKRVTWLSTSYTIESIVNTAAPAKECVLDTKSGQIRLERPCQQCGRMNDVGVSQCSRIVSDRIHKRESDEVIIF